MSEMRMKQANWHLSREVNLGQLLLLLSLLMALVTWGISVETRLALAEERHYGLMQRLERDSLLGDGRALRIERALGRIEHHLSGQPE